LLQEDVDDFFTPPTKPVKPLFVAAYLLAQLFFFIALLASIFHRLVGWGWAASLPVLRG